MNATTTDAPTIVLTDAAVKIINSDVRAFKADRVRYAAYVAEMNVTRETVAAHVALFREGFKAANSKADGDEVKAYATKVRNGLNYQLGKADAPTTSPDFLALVAQAVTNAVENGIDADSINAVVESSLAV